MMFKARLTEGAASISLGMYVFQWYREFESRRSVTFLHAARIQEAAIERGESKS